MHHTQMMICCLQNREQKIQRERRERALLVREGEDDRDTEREREEEEVNHGERHEPAAEHWWKWE